MKVKYSVIPFVPAFLAMMFLKMMSIVGMDSHGQFMGMNSMNITYTVIGIAVGLFVVCVLLNLFDRKTAPVYPLKRNFPAGLFAVLSGIAVLGDGDVQVSFFGKKHGFGSFRTVCFPCTVGLRQPCQ